MTLMRWVLRHKTSIAISLGIVLLIIAGIWFWGALIRYIGPQDPTDRKDVVQVFALLVAGVVGFIGAIVGIANFSVSRRNLQQQIDLEDQRRESTLELEHQRTQEAALQAYFEQMGVLLTDHNLINTDREDIRQLAQAQTLTVLARLAGIRKGSLVRFLQGASLIARDKTIVELRETDLSGIFLRGAHLFGAALRGAYLGAADLGGANLREASLRGAHLSGADLSGADLSGAILRGASLEKANLFGAQLIRADLREATLVEASLRAADLSNAYLTDTLVTDEQLAEAESLKGATMPNGQKYEDWLKDREDSKEDAENGGPS